MKITTGKELAAACKKAAQQKTLYVMGCFGAPMNERNQARYIRSYGYNSQPERAGKILAATEDTFGFDCVCLIKGLRWGWSGDPSQVYGGADYKSNGVPDIGTEAIIGVCSHVSEDFSELREGELLWMPGHVGIYIGDGLAVESTPVWKDGVQITACNGDQQGYPRRDWKKHGWLPYVSYEETPQPVSKPAPEPQIYRIRRRWEDGYTGQLGAYAVLDNAIRACPEGYCVFNNEGEALFRREVPAPAEPWEPKEGDLVYFHGNTHYSSANAVAGKACTQAKARITRIVPGKRHPYHLRRTGVSGPYGWVDRDTFDKE